SQLSGRVVDEGGVAVSGAKVMLSGGLVSSPVMVTTDEAGRFAMAPVPTGSYELRAEKPGFYALVSSSFEIRERPEPIEIVLNHRQEFEETVNVVYSTPVVDRQESAVQTTLTSEEIVDLPFSASHDFRRALPMVPGVVRDRLGRMHLNGGGDNQAYYSLDGFNITSPVSGSLENRISVDAVRSLSVSTGRYSAEYGKGSSGVMALETARGDDRFRFSATNFFPSFDLHNGVVLRDWNPRASFSGPLVKGRAWYFNALDLEYDLNIVNELPSNANRNRNWHGGDLSRFQINLTHRNILTFGLLFNFQNSLNLGISPLDPIETSRDRHERFYFFNIKDQAYLSNGWVLETGLALNQVNTREIPHGDLIYRTTPNGQSGNYFLRSQARAERIELLANVLTPQWSWHGRHSLKFGVVGDRIHHHQISSRRPFEVWRQGSRARLVSFLGNPSFGRDSSEFSGYLQDRWFPTDSVLVEAGMRLDWDQVMRKTMQSPRLAITWGPARFPETKFSAGVGVFYDSVNMALLTRDLDQQRVDTY
ncbi:MAG TPA: TonB-dependent receptor, partial [Acidobacteriota bacterium]|nr:TonB-dependent receptor [Acidobacteriota bacterium]